MTDKDKLGKVYNSVFGLALGDAWGYVTEFMPASQIKANRPGFPDDAIVTDDTQMSLYAIQALKTVKSTINEVDGSTEFNAEAWDTITKSLTHEFLIWLDDYRNVRAPGNTCISALRQAQHHNYTHFESSVLDSKGCGANMRNPWFGLLPYSDETIERLSLVQGALTHGHPLALASSVLTALAVKAVYTGEVILNKEDDGNKHVLYNWVGNKIDELLNSELNQSFIAKQFAHEDSSFFGKISGWLGEDSGFYEDQPKPAKRDDSSFEGWFPLYDRYVSGLRELQMYWHSDSLRNGNTIQDNLNKLSERTHYNLCEVIGAEGWVAEEALLLGVVASDEYSFNPVETLRQLVLTSGDSDSIAAIGGAIVGAAYTNPLWGDEYTDNLEKDYLQELTDAVDIIVHW